MEPIVDKAFIESYFRQKYSTKQLKNIEPVCETFSTYGTTNQDISLIIKQLNGSITDKCTFLGSLHIIVKPASPADRSFIYNITLADYKQQQFANQNQIQFYRQRNATAIQAVLDLLPPDDIIEHYIPFTEVYSMTGSNPTNISEQIFIFTGWRAVFQ